MITFPCAKINLGLNVVAERSDGYHDIETVFHPIPLCDALEIKQMDGAFPSAVDCDLKVTGNSVEGREEDNLVCKAYRLLAADHTLPRVYAHLFKRIPSGAGLGGGSADGAYMIRLLNQRFRLNIGNAGMERYAARLGSDCAFFVSGKPAFATGRGEVLEPVDIHDTLNGCTIVVVKPGISVSTAQAYRQIVSHHPAKRCREVVKQPMETWREELHNDFEAPVFKSHPELAGIKQRLYDLGAAYAQMSGSGSAIFGIFRKEPKGAADTFGDCFTFIGKLK